jgi:hypothetical protein
MHIVAIIDVYGAVSPTIFSSLFPLDQILVHSLLHSSTTNSCTELYVTSLQCIALHCSEQKTEWLYSLYGHVTHKKGSRMFANDLGLPC